MGRCSNSGGLRSEACWAGDHVARRKLRKTGHCCCGRQSNLEERAGRRSGILAVDRWGTPAFRGRQAGGDAAEPGAGQVEANQLSAERARGQGWPGAPAGAELVPCVFALVWDHLVEPVSIRVGGAGRGKGPLSFSYCSFKWTDCPSLPLSRMLVLGFLVYNP